MEKITTKQILEAINTHQYEQLDEYLSDVDWMAIEPATIVPQQEMRNFTKAINNKEVRLDVMQFLVTYAENYFMAGAERLVQKDYALRHIGASSAIIRTEAEHVISTLKKELGTQIKQLQSSGEFSGDKFSKQEKKIKELEEQNKKLEEIRQTLIDEIEIQKARIEALEHPERRHHIPNELQCEEFYHIVNYLSNKGIVTQKEGDSYYRSSICLQWNSTKALFGYFVCKICYLLELRTREDHLIWKPFKQAFVNFDDLAKQARDHASKNRNWEDAFSTKPEDAYFIDDALKYSAEQIERAKAKKQR